MGNKTIYIKDDRLWERARRVAGKEGISGVIQNALAEFVQRKAREAEGFKRFRLEVGLTSSANGNVGTTERIAFEGRQLVRRSLGITLSVDQLGKMVATGSDASDAENGEPIEVPVAAYLTKGKKLVLSVEPYHHGVYASLKDLAADRCLATVDPVERADFLDEISTELGEDWAVWIE